jgi:hypothetical protein
MFFQLLRASDAIVLQQVHEIVGKECPGHEPTYLPKQGEPVKNVTDHE